MLNLSSETSDAWVEMAVANIDTILLDHAHCEEGGVDCSDLDIPLSRIQSVSPSSVRCRSGELEHFELVSTTFSVDKPSNGWHRVHTLKLLKIMRETEPTG